MALPIQTKPSVIATTAFAKLNLPTAVTNGLQAVVSGLAISATGTIAVLAGGDSSVAAASAEALAAALGRKLVRVNASSLGAANAGATQQTIAQMISTTDPKVAILFFDEADALFGKRSSVKDAHDRYANVEVSYVLQRLEGFAGLTVLAMAGDVASEAKSLIRYTIHLPSNTPVVVKTKTGHRPAAEG